MVELHRLSSSVPLHTSPSPSMSPLPPDLSFHSQPTLPPPPPRSERPPPSIFQPPLPQVPPQSIPPQPTVAASPESRPLPAAPFSDLQKSGSFEMVTEAAPPEALPLPATPTSPLRLQTAPSAADDPLAANYGEIPPVDDDPHAVGKKMQFVVVRRSGLTVQRVLTVAPNLVSPQMVKFATTLSREGIVDVMANFPSFPVEFLSASQRVWLCGQPPPFEDFDFLFHMFFLARYCKLLEENSFRGRIADFFYMLLFGATVLTGIVLLGGMIPYVSESFANIIFLSNSLTFMMVYVWSKQNPFIHMSFLGLFTFTAAYLPWVLLGFSVLVGASAWVDHLGMIAGHAYYFLEDVYPRMTGRRPLRTPAFIRSLFADEPVVAAKPAAVRFAAPPENDAPPR